MASFLLSLISSPPPLSLLSSAPGQQTGAVPYQGIPPSLRRGKEKEKRASPARGESTKRENASPLSLRARKSEGESRLRRRSDKSLEFFLILKTFFWCYFSFPSHLSQTRIREESVAGESVLLLLLSLLCVPSQGRERERLFSFPLSCGRAAAEKRRERERERDREREGRRGERENLDLDLQGP